MSGENTSSRDSGVSETHKPPERISRKQIRRKIALTGIGKNGEHALAPSKILRHAAGCMKNRAGRHSAENSFKLCEIACCGARFLIVGSENTIDHVSIKNLGNKACADSLNTVRSGFASGKYGRLRGFDGKDFESWDFPFQYFAGARDRAARTNAHNKRI